MNNNVIEKSIKKIIINNRINCLISACDNMNQIIIYCHGFGDNKDRIYQHADILNINNIGIISFDFPCHGEDLTNYKDFTYKLGIDYIESVVNYIKDNYPNIKISIIGSSFGGYMVLNYINDKKELFHKVFLKYPAVNFYECTKRKLKINDNYFDNNDYFELPSGYRIYKTFYFDSKKHDIMQEFNKYNNNIYIIHGNIDKTVLLEDIMLFIKKYDIKLNIIDGATHGMKDHLDLVNEELINFII